MAGYASSCAHNIMCTWAHGAVCGRMKNQKQGDFHFSFFALRFFRAAAATRGKMRKMRQSVHGKTLVRASDICGNDRKRVKQKCEKCDGNATKCDGNAKKCDGNATKCDGNATEMRQNATAARASRAVFGAGRVAKKWFGRREVAYAGTLRRRFGTAGKKAKHFLRRSR